jgi:hypothetical protein
MSKETPKDDPRQATDSKNTKQTDGKNRSRKSKNVLVRPRKVARDQYPLGDSGSYRSVSRIRENSPETALLL